MTGPRPDTLGQVGGRSEKEKGRGSRGGRGGLRMRSLGNRLYDKGKKSAEWERTKQTNKGTCVGESLEEEGERRLLGK